MHRPKFDTQDYRANEKISAPQVRVIDENGEMLGVLEIAEALRIAQERELDLVEVSPKANPPVCKILEMGSFVYQKEKELKKQRKSMKVIDTKGIRLSVRIGEHDFNLRLDQGKKFLSRGDKLRVELIVRGREKAHPDVAMSVLNRFVKALGEATPIKIEQPVSRAGNRFIVILAAGSVDKK